MCIAILQKAGARIPIDRLEKCFKQNADGAGLAYVKKGDIIIQKGMFSPKHLIETYEAAMEDKDDDSPMLVHCRIATKGAVNEMNCHPFKVKGGVFIHNGSFWGGSRQDEKSDTRELAEMQFNNFHRANIKAHLKEIAEAVGGYNKMAFLFKDKTYAIVNEHISGTRWDNNVWYSNNSFEWFSERYSQR